LIAEAVSNWRIAAQRPLLARIFEHNRMKAASGRAAGAPFSDVDPDVVDHLRNVARAFNQLHENRQTADYDNSTEWSRTEVLTQIGVVQDAFASWRAIRNQAIANDYLLSLFVKDRQ
jgi:hypothetical protein